MKRLIRTLAPAARTRSISSSSSRWHFGKKTPLASLDTLNTEAALIPYADPYNYTNGHWLRLDKEQRRARHVAFDFTKLCDRAMACSPGAREIVECIQMEGGFNRAFLMTFDNGWSVVARVPFPAAGPSRLVTNSEIATIEYIRRYTAIPVPAVIDWSDDPANDVGTEYIIMERAAGEQLHLRWPTMNSEERMLVVKALGKLAKEMYSLELPAYGSLYFANAPVEKSNVISMSDGFCIGPSCANLYWDVTPGDERTYVRRAPNRGPCEMSTTQFAPTLRLMFTGTNHDEYFHGLLDANISRIPVSTSEGRFDFQGDVEQHLRIAETVEQVLVRLAQSETIKSVARPMLFHRDLHKRNIFVSSDDPTKITCLIDWQSSCVEPVYSYSDEVPDLCEPPHEAEAESPEARQKALEVASICRRTWEVTIMGYMKQLHRARTLDQDLLRIFRNAPSAWRYGVTPLRDDLISLSTRWSDLGLEGECPYQTSEDEVERHKVLLEKFLDMRKCQDGIVQALLTDSEGWVPVDRWEEVKEAHDTLFAEYMKLVGEQDELTEDEGRRMWPFDLP